MPKMSKPKPTADEIAAMASRGENISAHFTNKFTIVKPVQRVSIDLTRGMLRALDDAPLTQYQPTSPNHNAPRSGTERGAAEDAGVEKEKAGIMGPSSGL